MQRIEFTEIASSPIEFRGALDFDKREQGMSPRRLPNWTRMQIPDPALNAMVRMPSGVRMAFSTDSTVIELEVLTTRLVNEGETPAPVVFDLEVDGEIVQSRSFQAGNDIILFPERPGEFELKRGKAYSVLFEGLPSGAKDCLLWLPSNAWVELRSVNLDRDSSLGSLPRRSKDWIHYGSSISHCMEAAQPTGVWPVVVARKGGLELQNLGFGGQCHLDQFVARTIRELPADFISVKVGINVVNMDSMRERAFKPVLHGFLDTLREGKPDTPILMISPIFCPSAEHRPGPSVKAETGKFVTVEGMEELRVGCLTLTRIREIVSEVVSHRTRAGDRQLHYLSGLELFSAEDKADLPDDLHPNPAGYRRMGERFFDRVFAEDGIWA
ncbi:MAG: lipase [Proteobacteria bacterium]|nr:lipase [Pseudomonadota bacterium]